MGQAPRPRPQRPARAILVGMSVNAVVRGSTLDIQIRGVFDTTMCLSTDQHIPIGDILDARIAPWSEVRAGLGWRTAGGYWPGRMATGWYAVPGEKGARQFLAVYRDRSQLLVVDTRLDRPRRIVLALSDAPSVLADLTRARGGA